MKKLFFLSAFILMTGLLPGQNLKKGNFVGFHVVTITLNPNVTMDQYLEVMKNKFIPLYDKYFECKSYIAKGIRGECTDCISWIIVWNTEAGRDKFMKPDGGINEIGEAAMVKVQPAIDESDKLGSWSSKYTDWVVQ
jgi:hypothetical protein